VGWAIGREIDGDGSWELMDKDDKEGKVDGWPQRRKVEKAPESACAA